MKILRERRQKRSNLFRDRSWVTIVDGKSKRSFLPFWSPSEEQSIFHSIFKEFNRVERSKKKLKIPEHARALTNCGRNFVCFLLLIFFQKCQHRHSPECLKEIKKFICIQIHSRWRFGLSKSSVTGENGWWRKKVENKAFPRC